MSEAAVADKAPAPAGGSNKMLLLIVLVFNVVIAGGLGPGALGSFLFLWGLRRVAASRASVLTLLEPFVAVLVAALAMGEKVGALAVVGGTLILAGAVMVVTEPVGPPEKRLDTPLG